MTKRKIKLAMNEEEILAVNCKLQKDSKTPEFLTLLYGFTSGTQIREERLSEL